MKQSTMSTHPHEKVEAIISAILTSIMGSAGLASALNNIEQIGRIILLAISIFSGILLILVNWEKAIAQLKKFCNRGK